MENLRIRVKAAERATQKAKDELDDARAQRSRRSAKLDDYKYRMQETGRRGREYDSLLRKYDNLQDKMDHSRERVHRALDAHAELSRKSLYLLDRLIEAEDQQGSKRSRERYTDDEPLRRNSPRTHRHTPAEYDPEPSSDYTHERYYTTEEHKPRSQRRQRDENSEPTSRYGDDEYYTTEEHRPGSSRPHGSEQYYTTEEHIPPSHHPRRQSREDEAYFSTEEHYDHLRSPRSYDSEQTYTTEEHIPRSEYSQYYDTREPHSPHTTRGHQPRSGHRSSDQPGSNTQYTTEEHEPQREHRPHSNGSAPGTGRTTREDEPYSRSNPRPRQNDRDSNTEEHSDHSAPPRAQERTSNPSRLPSQQTVDSWWKYAKHCFEDYSKIETFPIPPALSCGRPDCDATSSHRPFAACEHSIRTCFGMVQGVNLRRERLRWHPDKFTACQASLQESFQKMASEVFIVLDKMHKEKQ